MDSNAMAACFASPSDGARSHNDENLDTGRGIEQGQQHELNCEHKTDVDYDTPAENAFGMDPIEGLNWYTDPVIEFIQKVMSDAIQNDTYVDELQQEPKPETGPAEKTETLVKKKKPPNRLKMYYCEYCGTKFNRKSNYTKHLRIHTGERPFHCDTCDASFTSKSNKLIHMRLHTGEKPFKCELCGVSFVQRSHLLKHQIVHAGPQKHLKCEFCNKTFMDNGAGLAHKLTQHAGEIPPVKNVPNNASISGKTEKPFTCDLCNASFDRRPRLKQHMRHHTGEKPHKCEVCLAAFSGRGSLTIHMRIHTGLKPFKCDDCNACFSQKGSLSIHKKVHRRNSTNPTKIVDDLNKVDGKVISAVENKCCEVSEKTIKDSLPVEKKMSPDNESFQPEDIALELDLLERVDFYNGFKFKSLQEGEEKDAIQNGTVDPEPRHQINIETDIGEKSNTQVKSKPKRSRRKLFKRRKRVSSKRVTPKPVDKSLDKLDLDEVENLDTVPVIEFIQDMMSNEKVSIQNGTSSSSLQQVIKPETYLGKKPETLVKKKKPPPNRLKMYYCEHCCTKFNKKSNYEKHLRIHTGERPFHCDICNASFTSKSNKLIHMRLHTGEKPFKCELCGVSFVQRSHLLKHQIVHAGPEKHLTCEFCNKTFTDNGAGLAHKLTQHADEIHIPLTLKPPKSGKTEKRFKCDLCNASFDRRPRLKQHKRTHTGEKPHKCEVCLAAFSSRGHLTIHMRIHTGLKPFKCEDCNACFSQKGSLSIHKKVHRRNSTNPTKTGDDVNKVDSKVISAVQADKPEDKKKLAKDSDKITKDSPKRQKKMSSKDKAQQPAENSYQVDAVDPIFSDFILSMHQRANAGEIATEMLFQ